MSKATRKMLTRRRWSVLWRADHAMIKRLRSGKQWYVGGHLDPQSVRHLITGCDRNGRRLEWSVSQLRVVKSR